MNSLDADKRMLDIFKIATGCNGPRHAKYLFCEYCEVLVPEAMAALKQLMDEVQTVTGETSDGYHTFNELYDYRRAFNAALFNEWAQQSKYDVHKSYKHSDGEDCFGGGWFIVMAELPTGQISNHYENKYWSEFAIPEKPQANEYDGHTPQQALDRIQHLTTTPEGETA